MQWVVHSSSRSPHTSLGYRTSEDMEASPAADNLTHEKNSMTSQKLTMTMPSFSATLPGSGQWGIDSASLSLCSIC